MDEEFKNFFKKNLKDLEINLTNEQLEKFYTYMNLLLEWNEKINLTALTEQNDIIIKHFVDSLSISKYIKENEKLADIGTGAGFPGIPISIVHPNCKITLVDSLNKRINFLDEVKEKLNLKNVKTIHIRAEDFGQNNNYREKYDIVTSRAVASLCVLSEYLIPLTKVGGKIICMKANNIEREIDEAKYAIKELGGKIIGVEDFYLDNGNIKRSLIIIEKINKTNNKYPRKAGIPLKKPLIK